MNIKEITPIDAGKLNKKFLIGRRSKKKNCNEQGSKPSDRYQVVGKFWGYIKTSGGSELEQFGKKFEVCTHVIHANWQSAFDQLTASDTLMWNGKIFEISHVSNVDLEDVRALILVTEIRTRGN